VDHVCVTYNGQVIGRNGKPILRTDAIPNPSKTAEAHTPLTEWMNWENPYGLKYHE
jgi:hypothetical protein